MDRIGPISVPAEVFRAYVSGARPAAVDGSLDVRAVRAVDSFEPTARTRGASRLIAAAVRGGVEFTVQPSKPASAALPMYRHPADRNTAATGITLGRILDAQG
ncbi:MAG: hypothetical protein DYG93_12335 [Leptolyngbya sp. PLA2]|nr:hypothetical protein [Leptolyngbya sp. PL-A2]MCQ3941468.1 hypothetical protein [cyanobacterium CYA1]MCZ7633033.1 hypothetical protein [Phycisphaerales bacterium]MDL1904580.1 hypothetical protein [Synechococcales cyanobacterium CNB]GIK18908.1 MAG: hypothetical protein BroJett004_10720 [Planctomycetota bacterium]